ncbi:golgin subfamily B member 1-like isoform X2 [Pseudophryne corroboree]|uniref:golgin subfamily B member 1-like isoform X2 n=1 Tax=Pseudophryne corroboree TaxID=495146 RepID=UPI003081B1EA
MWNWYSGDESPSPAGASNNQSAGIMSVADLTERLAHTQQLVAQLKDLIREKEDDLRKKEQELKEEKESSESKISKAKLQNKAKIASLTSQLEELKKQLTSSGAQVKKVEKRKGAGDGDQEIASANRGKILVLRKRVEELESQLSLKNEELQKKGMELEAQRLRGSEMDVLLVAKEEKLAEKEAYIIDLQMSVASNVPHDKVDVQVTPKDSSHDLQILIQNLTKKVGESEERYSLLQEQTESLKALLNKEKIEFQEKEAMYMENIRVYQNMILEKEKDLKELLQKHDQEIFKLAAKSDASADLHQLLKALKQKLHEEEEVLLGKNQVIDVLQKELDSKDQQLEEMNEKCRRHLSEKENLQSKLDAEKHVMRAQLRDMMEKYEAELCTLSLQHNSALQSIQEKHQGEIQEKFQTIQQLQSQLQGLASPGEMPAGSAQTTDTAIFKLQGEVKLKKEEASKSEAKFLKLKAWSKSRIRQLEEDLKISEGKKQELSLLNNRITELEEEKRELQMKLDSVADLQSINEQLLAKLVVYEEQQRKLQADLEQVAKRADSQTSESGSVDELQNQLLEWNEMSPESDLTLDHEREETSVRALRMAQIEEEREAMDSGQVELEEELSAARGAGKLQTARRKGSRGAAKLQDEYDYSNKSFEEQNLTMESDHSVEGENMGGSGLRAVVDDLELERNQLQEQIMTLEERCQELEERLQLQLRIESLQVTFDVDEETSSFPQSDNERLQTQVAQLRQQQSQDADKHYDLISTLNNQLKSLTNRNGFLENAVVEKEQAILDATARLDQLGTARRTLQEKEALNKELIDKVEQYEHQLEEVRSKQRVSESENAALKLSSAELAEKVSVFKERVLMQDSSLEKLHVDLDQTNEELDRLNTSHLEERSQLIYDLQRCEREMDVLKELLQEKDKDISSLSASLTEYSEQVTILKETVDFKDEQMREMSNALVRMERESHLLREAQTLDVQQTSAKMSSLSEQIGDMELELNTAKTDNENKLKEAAELIKQINENDVLTKNLRQEIQALSLTHSNHVRECSVQVALLKEQINASAATLQETEMKYVKEAKDLRLQLETARAEKEKLTVLLKDDSNKQQMFEDELKTAKEQYNNLVSGMSKKDVQLEELSNHLAERSDRCDTLDKELCDSREELASLRQTLQALTWDREELGKTVQEYQKQLDLKTESISKLASENKAFQSQIKLLEKSLQDKDTYLKTQINAAEEFGRKVEGLQDHNQHLCIEKETLLTQIRQKESAISDITQTLQDAQRKVSEAENQLSSEKKCMSNHLREQEEKLLAEIERISTQHLQNDSIFTAQLEEGAKECLSLKTELQEVTLKLQTQIQLLEKDLKEATKINQEKDDLLKDKIADYNTAWNELKQNREQNVLMQKQLEELSEAVESKKKALQEKDVLINMQSAQVEEMRTNLERIQSEERTLKESNVKVTEQVQSLNIALSELQQEFNSNMEENTTLKEKLDVHSKETEQLVKERDSVLLLVSNLETQHGALQTQVLQSQSVVDSLRQQLNTLQIEREQLNSNIQLLNTTLSSKSEEISVLSSHLSQQGHAVLSLKDQIDTLQLDNQTLMCSLEERGALLLQKEEFIQQMQKKLDGEGYYLQTILTLQSELQSLVSDRTQQQQKMKNQEQELQKLGQRVQLLKDKSEEAELLKTQLSEHVEIISDLHCQLKNLRENAEELSGALTRKDECLKEKVDNYLHLKAQFSELQDSMEAQKKHVEALMLDNEQYHCAVSEKDLTIKNSLLKNDELKEQLSHKEGQCIMLIKQVAELEEFNTKQISDLNELTVSIKDKETSYLRQEETLKAQLEQQAKLASDLQKIVHEISAKSKEYEQSAADKVNTMQNLQEKYASLYEQKQVLTESLSLKEEEISRLRISANEKDSKLQVLESSVQSFTNEVNLLREQMDKGNENAKNISEVLKLKDDTMFQHQKAAEDLKVEFETIRAEYLETRTQLQSITREREESKLLIENLQEHYSSQNQHIENLKRNIDNLNSRLLQDQHTIALEREQFQLQLEHAAQEKLDLEKSLQMSEMERENSFAALQKQLMEKAEIAKELEANFEHQVKETEARICSDTENLKLLKAENTDLQKQVSGQTEEIFALKVNLERNISELQQQSQKEVQKANEQNAILREQNSRLDHEIKVKESTIHSLLKDLNLVERQLCALCDENYSDYDAFDQESAYRSKLQKLSPLLSVALGYKTKVAELKEALEEKYREISLQSQSILSFEKERDILQEELKTLKEQKLGNKYVIEELAVAKETSFNQQRLLEEKEKLLMQMNAHNERLQEELRLIKEDLQISHITLDEERTKVLELQDNSKKKDSLLQDLNVQLNQQKELISTLSDQVKEKDTSLMQVMESMWNEMITFSEEKNSLQLELENLQSAKSSCQTQISQLSERLEACEIKLQQSEQILADKETYLNNLTIEKELQLEKFNKERENLKRKLQAALVIRKDLMQKLEKLEQRKQDELSGEQLRTSELRKTTEDLSKRLESIQRENEDLKSCLQHAKQELLEREEKTSELCTIVSEKDYLVVDLQGKVTELQQSLSKKDSMCQDHVKAIQEKNQNLSQIQSAMNEKLKTMEQENSHLVENLENLKCFLEKVQKVESPAMSVQTHITIVNPESNPAEGSFSYTENSVVHNNVHASLLCSQGNFEHKGKHASLLQSLSSSVKQFELLQKAHLDLQHSYKAKCTEYEQQKEQTRALQDQMKAQEEQLSQKDMELDSKTFEAEKEKLRNEESQKMKEYEDVVLELKSSIHEKNAQLLRINSEHEQLLSEREILKNKMQKLHSDIQQKQDEIDCLKSAADSRSTEMVQYESMKESMKTELIVLQNEFEASRMVSEGIQQTIQQITNEKDTHFKECQMNQLEIAQLKHNLELTVHELLEKDKEIVILQNSLQINKRSSEKDMEKMSSNLKGYEEEANKLQANYKQVKGELDEYISKLEKATVEISDLRTKLNDSRKENEIPVQACTTLLSQNLDLNQVVPETKPVLDNLQGLKDCIPQICKDCSIKQKVIEDLEYQVTVASKAMEDLIQDHKRKISEEIISKDHIQRKLQAALVSRKDLLKENKALKQNIESLNLEADGLNRSLAEIQEKQISEISLLTNKSKDLISENERLLLVNENLSAACESLKSTMETIVQEKEAFSFQLNSLKDSQMVELTVWKAKHGELNKEYESLLQAYENITDEIDKMRRVIDATKKEKHDLQMRFHDLQSENQELAKQIEQSNEEMGRLRVIVDSREIEIQKLKLEADRLIGEMEKTSHFDEMSQQNLQLSEENKNLKETCESLKLGLECKEKENNSLFIIKTALDKLQLDMNVYKSDMEIQICEMTSENEVLSKKVTEMSSKLLETEQSLAVSEDERCKLLEKLSSYDDLVKQETDNLLKLDCDLNEMQLVKNNLAKKVQNLEDDKSLLLEQLGNLQVQFCKVKNEKENLEMELLKAVKNNSLLSDKFKSLQEQTHVLSQQVEFLRAEKNNIVQEKEEHQLKVLRNLEDRVKCAQDDNRGTKSKSKELCELLKEKQQEINQLHRDSIRFQELILDLEEAIKGSKSQNENLQKDCDHVSTQLLQAKNDVLLLNEELTDKKHLLECANDQIIRLRAEFRSLKSSEFRESSVKEMTEKQADLVGKKHMLLLTTGSGQIPLSVECHKRNKPSEDLGATKGNCDVDRNKLDELQTVIQSKEKVLKKMESEKMSTQQLSRHPNDDELKALWDILTKREQELQQLTLENEKIRGDVQKQIKISQHMKQIIDNKDKEISLLISSKDGDLSSYLEQIQSQYRKQAAVYEHRLSLIQDEKDKSDLERKRVEKELQSLQGKYEKAIYDKALVSSEIEAFRKSMSSLQTNRDQLSSELQSTHQRNETVLNQKDNIIISTCSENSALKQELKSVINQVDDLNAENAMLGAQLIRYREDLNQVLSLKDHQLKELLRQKLDHIKNLEQEKCDLQKQIREMQNANVTLQKSAETVELENQKLISKVKDQEILIAAINKEKILVKSRKTSDSKNPSVYQLKDFEERYGQDLPTVEINAVSLGIESNKSAEETDKTYWDLLLENKQLKTQNESFGKAMAALQNNRDSLIDDFKELQWKYASELKTEKIKGEDLERQLSDFKSQLCSILKKNSLLDDKLLAIEYKITLDELMAEIDSLCNILASKGLEVTRLTSECAAYTQQIDAFAKAMASLQHDREQLLHLLKEGSLAREPKQDASTVKMPQEVKESEYLTMSFSQPDKETQVTELINSSAAESIQLRTRVQELERLLQEAEVLQGNLERKVADYQSELAELRSERNGLDSETQFHHHQISRTLTEKDRQIAELGSTLYGEKGVDRMALVGNPSATEKGNMVLEDKEPTKEELQRYIQEIYQRDLIIQQTNVTAMETVKMNDVLSAELKNVSRGLIDAQMKYTDLQNQYYQLQRELQTTQGTNRNNIQTEVPPGAPQERANVLVEIDNAELADLRRRLAEAHLHHEATQKEISQLSERLAEERARRMEAEETLNLTEIQNKRLETKSSSRDYEFSLQMESDDEREALIIDPTQNIVMQKVKGGTLSFRRWLRGRSLYCSKLLTSKSKTRYLFLTYLLGVHILILMCLTGGI